MLDLIGVLHFGTFAQEFQKPEGQKAHQDGDAVTAPVLVLKGTIPFDKLNIGAATADGTYRLALGEATVRLVGTAPPASPGDTTNATGPASTSDTGTTSGATSLVTAGSTPAPSLAPAVALPTPRRTLRTSLASWAAAFDVSDIYLMLVLAGAFVFAVGHLIRFLGVRAPWTSTGG